MILSESQVYIVLGGGNPVAFGRSRFQRRRSYPYTSKVSLSSDFCVGDFFRVMKLLNVSFSKCGAICTHLFFPQEGCVLFGCSLWVLLSQKMSVFDPVARSDEDGFGGTPHGISLMKLRTYV